MQFRLVLGAAELHSVGYAAIVEQSDAAARAHDEDGHRRAERARRDRKRHLALFGWGERNEEEEKKKNVKAYLLKTIKRHYPARHMTYKK